ncbi:hypothetical protein [Kitasatospora sp. NPDC086791]|uniref:hypothetical protein n=1 Tax=Kitasatospora sp. NPDC086791 TaxID=3155178 RepID=UPI003431C1F0
MTAGDAPYCADEQCIEDECSLQDPCCISICACPRAEDDCAYAGRNGDEFEDLDGVTRDVWYCPEHKTEWIGP